jgi:hypothetical protein
MLARVCSTQTSEASRARLQPSLLRRSTHHDLWGCDGLPEVFTLQQLQHVQAVREPADVAVTP